ncbi:hypothetical protein EN829_015025 [Mesorhizobium sp. M00.F.Ca.ET.186.01.1.1]|nr:hypothetical protein EN848_14410 [bacterium M00.F.Ca.ET.205.01.1.1]TGU52994.1 hypothetical protein EN795_14985 [bacterium M00.F.Ca.ET.152.01.1.1]TGV35963.1 hypothetical protein EN829_015025 [Mesorhizobium sp. M00.F.Ca.ET.186.01.1.1]TGZ43546.1 hypothetical protein EN805_10595 [bacterium M00.F.Ca.ET.162.01.1.1]
MSTWDIHYDALYAGPIAVDAVLTIDDTTGTPIGLRAMDKTSGQLVGFKGVDVATIGPAATVRVSEMVEKGISADDVDGMVLTLNGKDWKIINHEPLPAPTGEPGGELRLLLSEK